MRVFRSAAFGKRAVFTTLTCLMILFIFLNSAADGESSGGKSIAVMEFVNGALTSLHVPLAISEHFIRKLGHVLEYMALGLLATLAVRAATDRASSRITWSMLVGAFVPLCDETLQLFVPGRSGQVSDIWVDLAGFACGSALCFLFARLFRCSRAKRQEK